jgi:hypothetical protein
MLALTSCSSGGSGSGGGGAPPSAATCTVLYTSSPGVVQLLPSLLVDNDSVYWSEVSVANSTPVPGSSQIKEMPKAGGAVEILASGPSLSGNPGDVGDLDFTIDEFNLYWVTTGGNSQVFSVPLGGGYSPSLIASEPADNFVEGENPGITSYGIGGSVYWTTGGDAIYSSSSVGGTETVFSFAEPTTFAGPEAEADAGTLVVTLGGIVTQVDAGNSYFNTGYYEINPTPPPNSTAEFLTPFAGTPGNYYHQGDLITDGADVYGLSTVQGAAQVVTSVFKISGTSATTLAQAGGTALNVATDGTYIYYAGGGSGVGGGGVVSAYAIVGNTVTSSQCVTSNGTNFIIGSVGVHGDYLDEGYIYATGSGGGNPFNVLRMTKPTP